MERYGAFLGTRDDLARVMAWVLPRCSPAETYGTLEIVDARRPDCIAFESARSAVLLFLEPSPAQTDEEHDELLVRVRSAWAQAWQRWPDRAVSVDVATAGIPSQRTRMALRDHRTAIYDRDWIVYNVGARGMAAMIRPLFDEADDAQPAPVHEPEPTDNTFPVHYGQIYLLDGQGELPSFDLASTTSAGLLGAGPGAALMVTGRHTGTVGFTVSVEDHEPRPDLAGYEDVVEVSFESRDGTASLVGWAGGYWRDLPPLPAGPGTYRLRYHARGMDAAAVAEAAGNSEVPIDEYLLQIWPAPPSREVTLKRTSLS